MRLHTLQSHLNQTLTQAEVLKGASGPPPVANTNETGWVAYLRKRAADDDTPAEETAAEPAAEANATANATAAFVEIPDGEDKLHFFDFDNAKMLYKGDWAAYKASRPHDNDCSLAESDNWKGAQQCVESWECRGARMCERGGWCSGFDGCEGSPLPTQAPGLSATH